MSRTVLIRFCIASLVLAMLFLLLLFLWNGSTWTASRLAKHPLQFELYWDDQRVGWQSQQLTELPDGNWQLDTRQEMRATVRGTNLNEHLHESLIFAEALPHRLLFAQVQRNGETYELHNDGHLRVMKNDKLIIEESALDYALSDVLYSYQSAASHRDATRVLHWRHLDTQRWKVANTTVQFKQKHTNDNQYVWLWRSEDQYLNTQLITDSDGLPLLIENGALKLKRVEHFSSVPQSNADLYLQRVIPVDQSLGNAQKIVSLSLRWPLDIQLPLQSSNTQHVESGFVRVDQRVPSLLVDEHAAISSLQNETRYSLDNNAFVQKAKQLVAPIVVGDDEKKVQALLLFVSQHLKSDTILIEQDAAQILQTARGDCTEFVQLFVALARANGLPAREISGLVYLGDAAQAFGGHSWAEVAINGRWQEVDPMWNLMRVTATHLRMGQDEAGALATLVHNAGMKFQLEQIHYQ